MSYTGERIRDGISIGCYWPFGTWVACETSHPADGAWIPGVMLIRSADDTKRQTVDTMASEDSSTNISRQWGNVRISGWPEIVEAPSPNETPLSDSERDRIVFACGVLQGQQCQMAAHLIDARLLGGALGIEGPVNS